MKRAFLIKALLIYWAFSINAQPPAGYYNSAQGLSGTALQSALHNIIDSHTAQDYMMLHTHFKSTDSRPDSTVWDMYSDIPGGTPPYVYHFIASDQCGNYSQEGDCYNREHSFPKSWFGGSVPPMYSDLFQVYPTDGYVNSYRGNLPYAEVGSASWTSQNGSKRGMSVTPGYIGEVFEPIDAYKGDFARTYLYMAVRYYGEDASWPGSPMVDGAEPLPWAINMLLLWHASDTVSTKEISRNNTVYSIQNNRNPFIDDPLFATQIWGIPSSVDDRLSKGVYRVFPNPVEGMLSVRNDVRGMRNSSYVLTDICGRIILSGVCRDNDLDINTEELDAGLYFFTFTNRDANPIKIVKH